MTYEQVLQQQKILQEIVTERNLQDDKWGENRNLYPERWLAILGEEVGECCKASLEEDPYGLRGELLQVAAVAIAAIENYDREGRWRHDKT